ncbi:nickel-dependent lactate racemase [Extibacter sp. GGCC_0201]|uniref:nickel-dependent lactate racemase n=1 Tax=Extibacter sp. GGCC_0201 TaxID=2731209 RepID=UPI001AA1CBF8|nr:nickel-dependent lactate racemase [Extibacter sp. GGCC_0201]MBO1720449.1 nickel-dependent lactate racemase [Extibacter sp. GGCC_0201]
MKLEFGFGAGIQTVEVPDENVMEVLHANQVEHGLTGEDEVRRALLAPIGAPLLKDVVKPKEKIAIVTSDITRPMPTYVVMPPLLDALFEAGVRREDITLVFALGSHRKHTPAEMKKLAGARAYEEILCIDGDSSDCVHMGVTSRGTPVDIVRVVAEADRRICLGNIEYHYFAGYSGGAKAIMPGVSTREAIQSNHSQMVKPQACAGRLSGNPVREDIEEAGAICGIDYIVNVVLDENKKVIMAAAGDAVKAHREACRFLDGIYRKEIPRKADIVLVSQGGAPKDLNLYQTQKALDNAKHAVRKGGIIILIGSCKEGLGESVFEEWMTQSPDAPSMITRIQENFQLGGHKAAAIAMMLENADVFLVSELPDDLVRKIFLEPKTSAQEALNCAFERLGKDAKVLAMPYGGSTLPCVAD